MFRTYDEPLVVKKSFSVQIVGISLPTVSFFPSLRVGRSFSRPITSKSPDSIFRITPSGKYCKLYSLGQAFDLFLLTFIYPSFQSCNNLVEISLQTQSAPLLLIGQRATVPSGASLKSNTKSVASPK